MPWPHLSRQDLQGTVQYTQLLHQIIVKRLGLGLWQQTTDYVVPPDDEDEYYSDGYGGINYPDLPAPEHPTSTTIFSNAIYLMDQARALQSSSAASAEVLHALEEVLPSLLAVLEQCHLEQQYYDHGGYDDDEVQDWDAFKGRQGEGHDGSEEEAQEQEGWEDEYWSRYEELLYKEVATVLGDGGHACSARLWQLLGEGDMLSDKGYDELLLVAAKMQHLLSCMGMSVPVSAETQINTHSRYPYYDRFEAVAVQGVDTAAAITTLVQLLGEQVTSLLAAWHSEDGGQEGMQQAAGQGSSTAAQEPAADYLPGSISALTHCLMQLGKGSAQRRKCILQAEGLLPSVVSMLTTPELTGGGLWLLRALLLGGAGSMLKAMQRILVSKQDVLHALVAMMKEQALDGSDRDAEGSQQAADVDMLLDVISLLRTLVEGNTAAQLAVAQLPGCCAVLAQLLGSDDAEVAGEAAEMLAALQHGNSQVQELVRQATRGVTLDLA